MSEAPLKSALEKLGLRQLDFARLLDVSTRTVNLWATGAQPLPGTVTAYLRLLEAAEPQVREAEFARLQIHGKNLREGLYAVAFRCALTGERGRATAVLRNGKLNGGDTEGNMFAGVYRFDRTKGLNWIQVNVGRADFAVLEAPVVPPGIVQVGFSIGGAHPLARASAVIAHDVYEIELRFLGPLPD